MHELILIGLLVAMQTSPSRTMPEVKGPIRADLTTVYGQMHKFLEKKDLKGFMSNFSDSAVVKWSDGLASSRKEIASVTEAGMKETKKLVKSSYVVDYVRGAGPTYEMKVSGRTIRMVSGPDAKPHELQSTSSRIITWIKESGVWKVKRTEILKQKFILDGKPAGSSH